MQFVFLSDDFYNDYSHCKEIEQKKTRPYVLALVQLNGVSFAVPLRSNIPHKYALWTNKAERCGLDFSKTVVLTKQSYVDASKSPHIRPNEFDALRGKEYLVKQKLQQYIAVYKKAKQRLDIPRNQTLCQCSALQYFEKYI